MWVESVRSLADAHRVWHDHAQIFHRRRHHEHTLATRLAEHETATLDGFCLVCRRHSAFEYDHRYAGPSEVNWRERLVCPDCGLNNRLRLSAWLMRSYADKRNVPFSEIYVTEQVTPLGRLLRERHPGIVESEFLTDGTPRGACNAHGIRHEDITNLTFPDDTFHLVLSFDVLEHVPDHRLALSEITRVLKPGGRLLLTVPFNLGADENLTRAVVNDGVVRHLVEPEYHGDPLDAEGGVLSYHTFGFELLREMLAAGFTDAYIDLMWSDECGHIGQEQIIIHGAMG